MIEKTQFAEILETFNVRYAASFKHDGGMSESERKQVTLNVKFEGVTIQDMVNALGGQGLVVKWVNANRKNYASIANRSIIDVDFKRPGKTFIDPKVAVLAEASALSPKEQQKYIENMIEQLRALKTK